MTAVTRMSDLPRLRTASTFPTGSSVPKYRAAADSLMTRSVGPARAVSGSPRKKPNDRTSKIAGSARKNRSSKKDLSPKATRAFSFQEYVKSRAAVSTSGSRAPSPGPQGTVAARPARSPVHSDVTRYTRPAFRLARS